MRVGVLGCGRLGLPIAVQFARDGHDVRGVDSDKAAVDALQRSQSPFVEPGLQEEISRLSSESGGNLAFFHTPAAFADWAEIVVVCVPTPYDHENGRGDVGQIRKAVADVSAACPQDMVIVGKSSVPIGFARSLVATSGSIVSGRHTLVWSPDFMRESTAISDTASPTRIVVGADSTLDEATKETLLSLWSAQIDAGTPIAFTDYETAEMVKAASNAFLATKITFSNVMAAIADTLGADASDLSTLVGLDPRIGQSHLSPGLGYGGGCLNKDLNTLISTASSAGAADWVRMLEEVHLANRRLREEYASRVMALDPSPKIVGVLGLSFKPGIDDIRDSPAVDVAQRLIGAGVEVRAYDPAAGDVVRESHPEIPVCDSALEAADGADALLILTPWAEFIELDPTSLPIRNRRVVDARNCLDRTIWQAAGWKVYGIGSK